MKLNIIFGNQDISYTITFKQVPHSYIIQEPQIIDKSERDLGAFGQKIKDFREQKGENMVEVANAIGIDRSYLSKLENGHEPPTLLILNKLISHYLISKKEAHQLAVLAGMLGRGLMLLDKLDNQERGWDDKWTIKINQTDVNYRLT